MQRQAVPCIKAQAPLVSTGVESKAARDSGRVILAEEDGAVEEIDGRPEQVLEVWFQASVGERRSQSVEDVPDRTGNRIGLGQRSWIRLVLGRTETIELEFVEDTIGWR